MSFQETCDIIFKLYLYADTAKMIHYTIDSMHGHELADDVRDTIIDFTDDLAEQYFGYYGKPRFSQLSINQEIKIGTYYVDVLNDKKIIEIQNQPIIESIY